MAVSQQQFQQRLEQITKKLQSGDAHNAIHDIQSLPNNLLQHPNVQHLYALALKSLYQYPESLKIMQAIVSRYPKQPEFHNNLANLLKDMGESNSAVNHYKLALSLNPNYIDAFKNWLILTLDKADLVQAKQLIDEYRSRFLHSVVYQKYEADYFLAIKNHALAEDKYHQVLVQKPDYKEAIIGLSKVLIQQNKYQDAIELLQGVMTSGPSSMAQYQSALCYFELGKYEQSEQAFNQAIAINPSYLAAHVQLNEMLWQLGEQQKFGKSFFLVLTKTPELSSLRLAYIDMLINAEDYKQASQQVQLGLERQPNQSRLLYFKALLLANDGKVKDAFSIMQTIWQATSTFSHGIELIKLSIKLTKYNVALQVISELKKEYTQNQLVLAYESTCLKLTDPDAYEAFTQVKHSIKAFELPIPDGYDSLAVFLNKVQEVLVSMHNTTTRPLQQTLRKGTQTPGRLLDREHPILAQLKWAYETTVSRYIAELPDDSEHVFFKRKCASFKITGSWSVKLEESGFHVNHVHPEGWISSACYISLPDNITDKEGCIRFGQSPLELGLIDEPDLIITPKEGILVLFPSFMWHGTLPFHSNEMRLTAPFDVVPLEEIEI